MAGNGTGSNTQAITVTLDGRAVTIGPRETVLAVAERAGIAIPTLCHLEGLLPYGACRLCIVRVRAGDWSKLVTACNYPLWDGAEIETASEDVLAVRRLIVEALCSRCPGVPVLERLAAELGVRERRFPASRPDERCILCGLCVRVCDEVVGAHALAFVGRGLGREVGTPFMRHPESCIGCGACAHVCPTDCISMEDRALGRLRAERRGPDRPCRYGLMGLTPGALCPNDYACARCETDQTMMELCHPVHPVFVARGVASAAVRAVGDKVARLTAAAAPARARLAGKRPRKRGRGDHE